MRIKSALLIAALLASGCTARDEPQTNVTADQPAATALPNEPDPSENSNVVAPTAAAKPTPATSPCLTQDGELLELRPLKAIGTEPFWGARIEGRCVTYSTPEDQAGTRVWTRYTAQLQGGIWTGSLGGKPLVLRTRRQPSCSDGMSDNRYQIAVDLTVNGESRRGCAKTGAE